MAPRPGVGARPRRAGRRSAELLELSDRMRVNEAVREVVAEAVGELKDPRIGLVTVTGVTRLRDLREGTVYVRCTASERKREATLEGLEPRTAYLQGRSARELRLKRTPQLSFEYDPSVERGIRMTKLIDELAPGAADDKETGHSAVAACPRARTTATWVVSHENPDGDALGSMLGWRSASARSARTSLMYLAGDAPLPAEFGFMALDESPARAARRHRRARARRRRLRERASDRPGLDILDSRAGRGRHRPPPRQHPLRREQPDRRRTPRPPPRSSATCSGSSASS